MKTFGTVLITLGITLFALGAAAVTFMLKFQETYWLAEAVVFTFLCLVATYLGINLVKWKKQPKDPQPEVARPPAQPVDVERLSRVVDDYMASLPPDEAASDPAVDQAEWRRIIEESDSIPVYNAFKSAFTAAKQCFADGEPITDRMDLGGYYHLVVLTTQQLLKTYGHPIDHPSACFMVIDAAVASGKYTKDELIGAVRYFDQRVG